MRGGAPALVRLRSVTEREWRDLARAQLCLARAQLDVWAHRPWRLSALIAGATREETRATAARPDPTAEQWRRIAALERALHRAVRYGVLLADLIRRERIPGARVRIGVQRTDRGFAAHAWVELGHRVVGDRADHVAAFTPLADLAVLQSAPAWR
jgi:hypothetical protein